MGACRHVCVCQSACKSPRGCMCAGRAQTCAGSHAPSSLSMLVHIMDMWCRGLHSWWCTIHGCMHKVHAFVCIHLSTCVQHSWAYMYCVHSACTCVHTHSVHVYGIHCVHMCVNMCSVHVCTCCVFVVCAVYLHAVCMHVCVQHVQLYVCVCVRCVYICMCMQWTCKQSVGSVWRGAACPRAVSSLVPHSLPPMTLPLGLLLA